MSDILERIRAADAQYRHSKATEHAEADKRIQSFMDARNMLIASAIDTEGVPVRQVAMHGLGRKNPTSAKTALQAGRLLNELG